MSRRALLVGIDSYPGFGPESQLFGAVRDARAMAETLIERFAFEPADVTVLLDEEATRARLVEAMDSLRDRLRKDDQVILFFSGHGSQMTDRECDEGDGLDETLVPFDSGRGEAENRDLSDDEINRWAARVLEETPHLTLIFDCCHSATLHRPAWRVRAVPPDRRPVEELPPPVAPWRDARSGRRPLLISACRDDERAYEVPASVAGPARGVLSLHLVESLRRAAPQATWREVFAPAAAAAASDCPEQHPQISGEGLDSPIFGRRRQGVRGLVPGGRLLGLAARPNRLELDLQLFRGRGGAWHRTSGHRGAAASFVVGERLRADLRHGHRREIFVYLLDIGLTGRVTLLFPDLEGHEVLDPFTVLTVGARRGDALEMCLPEDLPPGRSAGVGHLLLLGAESRLSTARLLSGAFTAERARVGAQAAVVRRYRVRRASEPTS